MSRWPWYKILYQIYRKRSSVWLTCFLFCYDFQFRLCCQLFAFLKAKVLEPDQVYLYLHRLVDNPVFTVQMSPSHVTIVRGIVNFLQNPRVRRSKHTSNSENAAHLRRQRLRAEVPTTWRRLSKTRRSKLSMYNPTNVVLASLKNDIATKVWIANENGRLRR